MSDGSNQTKEFNNGHPTKRFTAFQQRADAYFTATVRIDPLFEAKDSARAAGTSVTFKPGARTAWHTHPLGQMLIVTSGCGWVQSEGGQIEEIRQGDVVWISPATKHWHGATANSSMTHIAIQEQLNGKVVEWMERSATGSTADAGSGLSVTANELQKRASFSNFSRV